jgi:hypothetical protein
VFTFDPDHVGIETFDDTVAQIAWSHHRIEAGRWLVHHSAPYRYVWPSELDRMVKITRFPGPGPLGKLDRTLFTSATTARSPSPGNCHSCLHAQIYQICPRELISAGMLVAVQIFCGFSSSVDS